MQISLQDPALILFDAYPKVGLLDHMVILCLIFWGIHILFSIAAAPFAFPTTVHKGSDFSTSLPRLVFYSFYSGIQMRVR